MILRATTLLLTLFLSSWSATAQWPPSAATNLSLGDGAGSQVQPKAVPSAAGGNWVSWFGGTGYDVHAQLQNGAGNEQFAHNGVLVSDRGFTSTQDYGLALATDGAALLAFRDDNFTGTQITAAKVTTTGALAWGANGIQLTNTTDFVAAPVVAAAPGGGAFVAWTQGNTVRVQRLDGSGSPVWGSDTVLTPASGNYSVSDAQASGTGVIVAFIADMGFGSPRHLYAQRIAANGTLSWGSSHVAVFDGGSLQFGNFPDFEADGSGGAVFSWYDTAGAGLQCYVQHVDSSGTEQFAHNGVAVSTNATQQRVSPDASYDAQSGEITVAWTELNGSQSMRGVSAQRLDASGTRLWGASGTTIVSLGSDGISFVRAQVSTTNSFVGWFRSPGLGSVIEGVRLDSAGVIDVPTFSIASTPSNKGRLRDTLTGTGDVVYVWSDDRAGTDDVLGQNVQDDGSLGARTWVDLGGGSNGIQGVPTLAGSGPLTGGSTLTLTLTNGPLSTFILLWIADAPTAFPALGGTVHTFPFLDQVLLTTNALGAFVGATTWPSGVPAGFAIYFQFICVDATSPFGLTLSNGLQGTTP